MQDQGFINHWQLLQKELQQMGESVRGINSINPWSRLPSLDEKAAQQVIQE